MKICIATAVAALTLSATNTLATEGPSPQGMWSRGDGKAKVEIAPCGDDLCAVNTWIKPGTPSEKVGDKLVMTVTQATATRWTGKAYDPQRKMTYRLTMTVGDDRMTTTGCVLGVLCKSMGWTRIS